MSQVVDTSDEGLAGLTLPFDDERLKTMLFRYKARNAPYSLSESEVERWQRYRQYKFFDDDSPSSIKMPEFLMQLEQLSSEYARQPEKLEILKSLYKYAQNL
jgi:exodeoxyribonuclease-1